MTDKNTIDEVNVSKCKHYNNGWCLLSESCDQIKYKSCHDMTLFDCYYKQLKRKEQEAIKRSKELIRIRKELLEGKEMNRNLNKQLDQLKAENEELKNFHINLVGVKECEIKELVKYKQALSEIKEIAITGLEGFCPKCSRKECEDNNCIETAIRDILQKCEVLNDI
jgi:DNA repair ATPase RecN